MKAKTEMRNDPVEMTMPTEEQIRMRAYEIHLARNGNPGSELDDWLQAESELTPVMNMTQAA